MTRSRVLAAIAGIITVLLLQATVVAPATYPWPVSLPAVLVAAVALADGPASGMSLGFAAGLVADLGSRHPAGVLALSWLGVGLVCGLVAPRHGVLRDALLAGLACGVASTFTGLVLALVHGGDLGDAFVHLPPTALVDAALAMIVVPVVGAMLGSESLHAAEPAALLGAGRD